MVDITKIGAFVESSPYPAWLATSRGNCVYANPALERLTGLNSEKIKQTDWRSFLQEEDRAAATASWQRSLANGTPYHTRLRMRGFDSASTTVELIAFGHAVDDGTELWLFIGSHVGTATHQPPLLEAQLQSTLNVIPAYAWYALPSGALAFVNERTAEYLGLPKDDALRFGIDTGAAWDSHITFLHPDDREETRKVWTTCLTTGTAGELSFRVRNAEGKYRWFLSRAEPLRANDGTLLFWIGVNLDIDDGKRAEDALRKREKELREVIDTIPASVWSALPDGSNTYVNKRFVEYSGLSVEQTAGSGWQAATHPDDLQQHVGKWLASVSTGRPHENEARFRRADGQYRWHLDRGVPLRDEDGNVVKWYGVLTDIEDRKRAEEALQSMSHDLQESKIRLGEAQRLTHVGYWFWDLETNRLTWSDETYRIFGLRPQERPIDVAAFQEMIHPEDREFFLRTTQDALRGDGRPDVEFRIIRPNGEVRTVYSQGDVRKDKSGKPYERFGTVQDITDRKRTEESLQSISRDLQESKARFEEAQRITHVGYWERDLVTSRITWSDETYRIYGLQPQEHPMDLNSLRQKVHPEDWEFVSRALNDALAGGPRYNIEYRLSRPTGELRVIHSEGDVKRDASGLPYQMFGIVQDITDRKRAEEALKRSEFYLREGERLAHMGSWAFNPSGFFDYWSQELFQIYGLDPQLGTPTLERYLATLHPQDRQSMAETIKTMCAEHCGCDVKKLIVRPDGEQRYIRCVGIPVVEGEVLKGFLGTAMDITEQELLTQELERQQAYLTEAQKLTHTSSWAWRVSDRNLVHLSAEWYRVFSCNPSDGPPNWEKRLDLVHPDDRLAWKNAIERAIAEKTDYDVTFRIVLSGGIVKWIHTAGHPVLTATGDLVQFLGSSTDITDHKRAEEEREKLRLLEDELAHINRVSMMGEMAASLAHEIKQPIAAAITSANSCIEWLSHDPPNIERARATATRIDRYGKRAAEIIDRIRSFYRKSHSERELIDVNGIIHEMLALLQGEATRFSIEMHTELAPKLPKITADRIQLQQVFMNLMLNAIEAMNELGGELTVRSQLDQDGQLLFSVSDTGPGLPVGSADQIFSAFFTTKPQGSGMGLAISRTIVESHAGRMWATANDGGGATFHFTLPAEMQ
jgi:PAS domain S-box-containing protein